METTGKTYEYDEALRARTEAYTDKDTGAISRNLLGKRIGVSGASVSTYVNRKMACSPENIEAKLREYFRQEANANRQPPEKRISSWTPGTSQPPFPRMRTRPSSTHSRNGSW